MITIAIVPARSGEGSGLRQANGCVDVSPPGVIMYTGEWKQPAAHMLRFGYGWKTSEQWHRRRCTGVRSLSPVAQGRCGLYDRLCAL